MSGEELRAAAEDAADYLATAASNETAEAEVLVRRLRAALAAPSTPEPSGRCDCARLDLDPPHGGHEDHCATLAFRAAPSTEPALDGMAAIKAAHPDARFGMNENDLGMFEVWAKVDRVALGFASGWSVDEAFAMLAARLAESQT